MQQTSNVTPLHRQDCAARPLACVQPLVVLTGRQIRQLAALASSEDAEVAVGFARDSVMTEDELRKTLAAHSFSIANLSSRLTENGTQFEYRMVLRSRDPKSAEKLSQHLRTLPQVTEFRISPTGD